MSTPFVNIKNLHVAVDEHEIINGLNLAINKGEIHAIMGPKGSGKSTLAQAIAGKDDYNVSNGTIEIDGLDIAKIPAHERAHMGVFLSFQYPVEIPGLNNAYFLRSALNVIKRNRNEEEIDADDFLILMREHMQKLKMDESFLHRSLHEGFSGGEKKRNEILQMSLLKPRLCILDETDSGLDIDALKLVADGINSLRDKERSFILITHYQRLLDYVQPDVVHVMVKGQIVESGDKDLDLELEKNGYDSFINKANLRSS
jgi:Fe-S cluster assembly ATP-binding protein